MNIETINENINASKFVAHEKRIKVVEGDISVPDIKPDILSLVSVDSEVYITKQEVEEGKVHIEGVMDVSAIYMSEDENGTFKSLSNVFNFYETFDITGVNENSTIDLKVHKGATECKIINGRKINIKSPITLDIKVMNNHEYNIARDVVDDRNIELQKNKINMNMLNNCKTEDVELKENVNLDEDSLPIGEILKATIKIVNEDYKISYNKILAKADAIIKVIYAADNENQTLESFEKAVPVMGFVDFEGINENMNINLDYNVKSFILRPIYQDLKSLSFSVESTIQIKACVYDKNEIEIISDIYNPDMDIQCEYEEIQILQNIINESQEIEMLQGLLIPDLDNLKILNIEAKPNVVTQNILDGKIALEGNIDFDILYYNETKRILETKKMQLPFQQVIKIESLQSGMNANVGLKICKVEYQKIDGSQIQIKLTVMVHVCVEKQDFIRGIRSMEATENTNINMPSIVIYYIKSGDTLWNIAKKYHTTINELIQNNELKDDRIYPGQQLIIPRRTKKTSVELL